MDEKKKSAVVAAAKKLIEKNAPEEDVLMGIEDLGISENEARKILDSLLPKPKKESAEPKREESQKKELGEKEARGDKKTSEAASKEKTPEKAVNYEALSTHASGIFAAVPKTGEKKEKAYIPKLRKGGKEKIKEIIVEPQIGKKTAQERPARGEEAIITKLSEMEEKIEGLERKLVEERRKKAGKRKR